MANTITFNATLALDPPSSFTLVTGNAIQFAATLALGPSIFRIMSTALTGVLNAGFPAAGTPMVDPRTGLVSDIWLRLFLSLWERTGGAQGALTTPKT